MEKKKSVLSMNSTKRQQHVHKDVGLIRLDCKFVHPCNKDEWIGLYVDFITSSRVLK